MTDNAAGCEAPPGFADRLWTRTQRLHRDAERSGIIRDLLRGDADRGAYALLLRNLLPVYAALEHGLDAAQGTAAQDTATLARLARPEVYRAAALRADLAHLGGEALPLLAEGQAYAARVEAAAREGTLLVAHAYTRYLGDLNGGQILRRLIGRHLGLGPECLAFYDFSADPMALAHDYRAAIDAAGAAAADPEAIIEEACTAFRLTIALSEAVLDASRAGSLGAN